MRLTLLFVLQVNKTRWSFWEQFQAYYVWGSVSPSLSPRWHSLATQKDALALEVTPSVSDLLLSLGEQLAFIEAHVSPLLTPPMFETICDKIDQLFINEVRNGPWRLHLSLAVRTPPGFSTLGLFLYSLQYNTRNANRRTPNRGGLGTRLVFFRDKMAGRSTI